MSERDESIEGHEAEALRTPALVPLGMTARLEMSVVQRGREPVGFSFEEKICAISAAFAAALVGGGPLGVGVFLIAGLTAFAYVQWTVLVEESPSDH